MTCRTRWKNRLDSHRRPWTETEDKALIDMCRIGLASEYWQTTLPERDFGDITDRRLALREAGQLQLAREI